MPSSVPPNTPRSPSGSPQYGKEPQNWSIHPTVPGGERVVDLIQWGDYDVVYTGDMKVDPGRLSEYTYYDTKQPPPDPLPPGRTGLNLGSPYSYTWDYRTMAPSGVSFALLSQVPACDATAHTSSVSWSPPALEYSLLDENQAVLATSTCDVSGSCSINFAGSLNNWTVTVTGQVNIVQLPFVEEKQTIWGVRAQVWERCDHNCVWNWGISSFAGGTNAPYKIVGNGPARASAIPLIDAPCTDEP